MKRVLCFIKKNTNRVPFATGRTKKEGKRMLKAVQKVCPRVSVQPVTEAATRRCLTGWTEWSTRIKSGGNRHAQVRTGHSYNPFCWTVNTRLVTKFIYLIDDLWVISMKT